MSNKTYSEFAFKELTKKCVKYVITPYFLKNKQFPQPFVALRYQYRYQDCYQSRYKKELPKHMKWVIASFLITNVKDICTLQRISTEWKSAIHTLPTSFVTLCRAYNLTKLVDTFMLKYVTRIEICDSGELVVPPFNNKTKLLHGMGSLTITGDTVDPKMVKNMIKMSPSLTLLDLSGCYLSSCIIHVIVSLFNRTTNLTTLCMRIYNEEVANDNFILANAIAQSTLTCLDLSNSRMNDQTVFMFLQCFRNNTSLRCIKLYGNILSNEIRLQLSDLITEKRKVIVDFTIEMDEPGVYSNTLIGYRMVSDFTLVRM